MQNDKIAWEAFEYVYREKNPIWFWYMGAVALVLTAVALFFFDSVLFAGVVVLSALCIVLFSHRKPDKLHYEVTRVGVTANKTFYPYASLNAFAVDQTEPNRPKLFLTSHKLLMPMIIIPLTGGNADAVRSFISNYLAEAELQEPLSHKIMEYFGF